MGRMREKSDPREVFVIRSWEGQKGQKGPQFREGEGGEEACKHFKV